MLTWKMHTYLFIYMRQSMRRCDFPCGIGPLHSGAALIKWHVVASDTRSCLGYRTVFIITVYWFLLFSLQRLLSIGEKKSVPRYERCVSTFGTFHRRPPTWPSYIQGFIYSSTNAAPSVLEGVYRISNIPPPRVASVLIVYSTVLLLPPAEVFRTCNTVAYERVDVAHGLLATK